MRPMILSILVAPALLTAVLVTVCGDLSNMGKPFTTVISVAQTR